MTIRHTVDLAALTVVASDSFGNVLDMTEGERLSSVEQLRDFIQTAWLLGAFDEDTRNRLILDTVTEADTPIGLTQEGRCVADVLAAKVCRKLSTKLLRKAHEAAGHAARCASFGDYDAAGFCYAIAQRRYDRAQAIIVGGR